MYTPSHFQVDDLAALHAQMQRHPFALLVTPYQGELHMTHLPLHLDIAGGGRGTLEGHLARVNPHCDALKAGAPSVAVFRGPDAYVSPRWYLDPAKNVPTWNYVAVHAHGRPQPVENPADVLKLIGTLTDEHEAYIEQPWNVREAQAHAEKLASHVLGFRLPIERLEGKFKLSQNRPPADRARVMQAFARSAEMPVREMLGMMEKLYTAEGQAR